MSWLIWIWLGVFVVTLIIEFVTTELVSIWPSLASFVTMIVAIFLPIDLWWVEVIIFAVLTIALLIATRPLTKRFLMRNRRLTNIDTMIGAKGEIIKKVTLLEHGEIKIQGVIWSAITDDGGNEIAAGTIARVTKIEGNKLVVVPFNAEQTAKED